MSGEVKFSLQAHLVLADGGTLDIRSVNYLTEDETHRILAALEPYAVRSDIDVTEVDPEPVVQNRTNQ